MNTLERVCPFHMAPVVFELQRGWGEVARCPAGPHETRTWAVRNGRGGIVAFGHFDFPGQLLTEPRRLHSLVPLCALAAGALFTLADGRAGRVEGVTADGVKVDLAGQPAVRSHWELATQGVLTAAEGGRVG